MKRKCTFVLLIVALCLRSHAEGSVIELRKLFEASVGSSTYAKAFFTAAKEIDTNSSPLLIGFKAMSELMMCNHVMNPITKLSHFKRGKALLEAAIAKDPKSIELRYFRFSTQCNAPAILNYNSNLVGDKKLLVDYLKTEEPNKNKDEDLYARIQAFMLTKN
jgi:hypothetical protein